MTSRTVIGQCTDPAVTAIMTITGKIADAIMSGTGIGTATTANAFSIALHRSLPPNLARAVSAQGIGCHAPYDIADIVSDQQCARSINCDAYRPAIRVTGAAEKT